MNDEELLEFCRTYALRWLNSFNEEDSLGDDFFTGVEVLSRYDSFEHRILLLEMHSDDEGGPALMFIHLELDDDQPPLVRWAAWYFDTMWGEMKFGREGS